MKIVLAFLPAVFLGSVFAQHQLEKPTQQNASYRACVTRINHDPQNARGICRQYLATSPSDDPQHIKRVQDWLTYESRVQPYVQFLQGLTMDASGRRLVYQPDTKIDLPQTSQTQGPFTIHISRSFAGPKEEFLLRKAEATYTGTHQMIREMLRRPVLCEEELVAEKAPLWGRCGNGNIEVTDVLTARAVRYYYDLTLAERKNPQLSSGFTAVHSNMDYSADVKFVAHYTHKKATFANVYVAELTLKWGFTCGGLCGVGWTRNKVVVLDASGNVLAMYLDAPVNNVMWVS